MTMGLENEPEIFLMRPVLFAICSIVSLLIMKKMFIKIVLFIICSIVTLLKMKQMLVRPVLVNNMFHCYPSHNEINVCKVSSLCNKFHCYSSHYENNVC